MRRNLTTTSLSSAYIIYFLEQNSDQLLVKLLAITVKSYTISPRNIKRHSNDSNSLENVIAITSTFDQ